MQCFLKLTAAVFFATALSLCLRAEKVDKSPVTSFDLKRYLGTWYEIARFDHPFERGISHAAAEYVLRDDGRISVTNTGWKDSRSKTAIGKAKQPDPVNNPALLRVSFFLFFYSDYRVLMIDDDYCLALVGSSSDKYLWILSRSPQIPQKAVDMVLSEASRRGYDTSRLIWVNQERGIDNR